MVTVGGFRGLTKVSATDASAHGGATWQGCHLTLVDRKAGRQGYRETVEVQAYRSHLGSLYDDFRVADSFGNAVRTLRGVRRGYEGGGSGR